MHDHPVSFLSIVVWGGYSEMRPWRGGFRLYPRNWYNFIRATDIHRIIATKPAITVCFMGPVVRKWGFWTKDGWMYWRDYNKKYDSQ